ncbi:AAA family ATPase [Streptomyces sp. NPDC015237]|uniref:AAA family ATPase n=1 Tax=Streptomyces sp. NPDC015237 TaxID=3364949 RepID=UPI0036F70110
MDEAGPRRLVIIAVDDYHTGDEGFTAGIQSQVEAVTDWLADPSLDGGRRFEIVQPKELLTRPEDLRFFLALEALGQAHWSESLVVYITGHGLRGQSRRHYLTFADTERDRLLSTAFPTGELVTQVMDSEAEHVLVLVDSCFAGSLRSELGVLLEDLRAERRDLQTLAVITSGDFEQRPRVGEFTELLTLALDKVRDESAGLTASHLSLREWESLLNSAGDDRPDLLRALWVWPDSRRDEPSMCLPNPRFEPQEQIVEASRQPVSLPASALEEHWHSRASGRTAEDDAGWYFSGRQSLMAALVEFVHRGEGVLVVTGAAGSGKSALLARLVTLSDHLFVERFTEMVQAVPGPLRPRAGAVDAAVLARGKSSLALTEDLLGALGGKAVRGDSPVQVLLQVVAQAAAERRVTVVIDGLDEAREPLACLSDVVAPLARLIAPDGRTAVRLVLGMRSSAQDTADGKLQDAAADQLLDALDVALQTGGVERYVPVGRLRTDGPQTGRDVSAYVQALLESAEEGPYAGHSDAAAEVAAVIAEAVNPSFLDARLAAAQLRVQDSRQDVHDPRWRRRLLDGTTALLSSDLRQVAADQGVDVRILLAVLRATAFAQGAGLPWAEVWPTVAAAVLGPDAPPTGEIDTVIRTVRHSRLVGYLAHGEEDGRVTYRPAHQRVTEVLLSEPGQLLTDQFLDFPPSWDDEKGGSQSPVLVHRAIAHACARLAKQSGGAMHPYVRRHTVAHAEAGHVLDDSIMPLELAAQESSGTLRARLGLPLPVGDAKRRILTAAGLIEPYVNASVDEASRLASLHFQLAATAPAVGPHNAASLFRAGTDKAGSLIPLTVAWQPRANVLAAPQEHVHALCALDLPDGRGLLAAGTRYGVGVWDSTHGHRIVHIDTGMVRDMTVAQGTSGRSFLVTAGPTGAAVFDPLSGQRLADLKMPGLDEVRVLSQGPHRWKMAVLGRGRMAIWQPSEGRHTIVPVPEDLAPAPGGWLCDREGAAWRLFRRRRGGRPVLFNPLTCQVRQVALRSTVGRSLATVPGPGGHDLLAVARSGQSVRLFDPFSETLVMSLPVHGQRVVELTGTAGRRFLGVLRDGSVHVWDTSGEQPREVARFASYPGSLLAGVRLHGQEWGLASSGAEGVLLQRKPGFEPVPDMWPPGPTPRARQMMTVVEDGKGGELVAACTADRIRLLDPVGHQDYGGLGRPAWFLEGVPAGDDGPAVAFGNRDGLFVWYVRSDRIRRLGHEITRDLTCLALRLPDGQPGLVVSGPLGVSVASLTTDWRVPLLKERNAVSALLALPSPAGRTLVAGLGQTRLWVWDVSNGEVVDIVRLRQHPSGRAMCTVPLSDGRIAVAVATTSAVTVWDPGEWQELCRIETRATSALAAFPSQSGGSSLLATGNGSGLRLWDPQTGRLVHSLLTAAPVTNAVHTSSGGHCLHIGGPAGVAALGWPQESKFP